MRLWKWVFVASLMVPVIEVMRRELRKGGEDR